ncbi:MAG: Gfo/Idh/MocA family oxidoreductase [Caldilineaceae bacterium SB0675_bin_29]|uniref:Gfo/Idh/MocA family oxidoreductase n=1 Tax=Caldilineaceae bacterium SB0675_bin_29 TaxID=2605266 RepID=A0A6B1G7K1_9CHLR|nr:Gfo/Idh/MocA family oxidoreductase [Caldilineaceae bacterium SB0675_bin_29]
MSSHQFGVLLISGRLPHQDNYALNLRAAPRCTLVGLTDEKDVPPERAQLNKQFADDLDIPYLPDLDEALARDDVHVVSICADPERRGRIAARCADAGKHVYVDKPMTPYLSHADAVVTAVERAGVRSQMFSSNHQPWVAQALQVVQSGELGELTAIHVDNLFAKGPNGTAALGAPRQAVYPPVISNFVDAKAELYAIGVYALGFVCLISGRAVETVFGSTANYFFEAHQRRNMEDFGFLSLTLEGGLTATITGGRIGWSSHPAGGSNQIHLIGTKGSLFLSANRPSLEIHNADAPWTPPEIHPRDPMGFWRTTQEEVRGQPKRTLAPLSNALEGRTDASYFIDCIVEERESGMNARQAAYLTEILLAGYKSAAEGQIVKMPLARDGDHAQATQA